MNARDPRESVYQVGSARFRVLYGDLTQMTADVLVSSDDNYLSMGGGISMALASAGGAAVVAHARRLIPVPHGDVAVTTAGELRARYIFHAVTIDHDKELYPDAACIDKLVRRSLELAGVLDVRTIAYPALGTGVGGFPFQAAADVMTRAIAEHLAGPTSLEDVALVLRARPGVKESDLDLFYERAVGLAALSSQSGRLAGAVEQLRRVGHEAGMPELIARLDQLVEALTRERAALNTAPPPGQDTDRLHETTHLAEVAGRTIELATHEGTAAWDQRVEAKALQTRLEGLGTQLNIHIATLNKLEIEKAKYGGLGVPVILDSQIEDINAEIERVEATMTGLRQELARVRP